MILQLKPIHHQLLKGRVLMRLRHKPWAQDRIKDYPQYVPAQPELLRGKWHERFDNST